MRNALILLLILSGARCSDHSGSKSDTVSMVDTPVIIKAMPVDIDSVSTEIPFNLDRVNLRMTGVEVQRDSNVSFRLEIPENYRISVAAQKLNRLRFLSKSPDGRLFATDMHNLTDNKKGRVLVFEGWNDSSMKFSQVTEYLTGLHNPNQVEFFGGYIYVAETGRLSRYKYVEGSNRPGSGPEVIATFPDYGLSYKYGGWHLTRSLAIHRNKLYVSIGSSCNACVEQEELRAVVLEMDPDGKNPVIFASGLRNSVGIGFIRGQLWGTGMGRDLLGPDKPEDLFQRIDRGGFYGWPYYFQFRDSIYEDPEFSEKIPANIGKPPVALTGFTAHSAPLGFEFLEGFKDSSLNNSVLVALHGSTTVGRKRGNEVVRVSKGRHIPVVSGFLAGTTEDSRMGRPCDVLMFDDSTIFITDDKYGTLYCLRYAPNWVR